MSAAVCIVVRVYPKEEKNGRRKGQQQPKDTTKENLNILYRQKCHLQQPSLLKNIVYVIVFFTDLSLLLPAFFGVMPCFQGPMPMYNNESNVIEQKRVFSRSLRRRREQRQRVRRQRRRR
jgi:hypothetical protein